LRPAGLIALSLELRVTESHQPLLENEVPTDRGTFLARAAALSLVRESLRNHAIPNR
jgi:hypothetical protein